MKGLILTLVIISHVCSANQTNNFNRPSVEINKLILSPSIDGDVLNDEAWKNIEPISDFWQTQPFVGQPVSQKTEVFIGYTDRALHIAVIAYDENPELIIATDSRRDSSLDDTDSFRVLIDGLMDRQNGFVFGTNPASVEYDGQVMREAAGQYISGGQGGFNRNWDAPWTVQSKIGEFGWSAEMRIPFTSLRYGNTETQSWGMNFERRIRRNNEIAYWVPMSQDRDLLRVSEAGTINGINPPKQKNLQITPFFLGKINRGGSLDASVEDTDFGVDIKYSITPSLTLDATYNTDFAQVEVDEQKVNLDRFSLFFPEKRPFFLENSGQFTVGDPREVELFFSRRIGIAGGEPVPIDTGLRLSGKLGTTTNIGLLHMSSHEVMGSASQNDYTVARINQELENRSSIGFLYVSRDGNGSLLENSGLDKNDTYAVDGRWGIGDNGLVQAWMARTETPDLNGRNKAFSFTGDYNNADWALNFGHTHVGEDFNPEVGFLSRQGYRKWTGRIMRRYRPVKLWDLFELRPHIQYNGYWGFDGFHETGFLHIDNHWEFKNGSQIHTGMNVTKEGVRDSFEIIDGVFIQPGTYNHKEAQLVFMGNRSAPLNFGMRAIFGGRFGGDRVTLTPTLRYRIGEKFSSEFAYIYNDFDLPVPGGKFTANLARIRFSYSFTPKILLQLLAQYNEKNDKISTNLRFSWLQSANTGLYLVYNEIDDRGMGNLPRGRELILKFSRIFDVLN